MYPFLLALALYIMNYSTCAAPDIGNRDVRVVGTAVIARGLPIKVHFAIDLSNFYSYNHVIMYTCDCQFH